MATRPIYIPQPNITGLVNSIDIEFAWHYGYRPIDKKKNIKTIHNIAKEIGIGPILEVSTKSDRTLGRRLSAFNVRRKTDMGYIYLESLYQGSKKFELGGPYRDLYGKTPLEAKRDKRLKTSGPLIGFDYFNEKWAIEPKTAFFEWLYITALLPYKKYFKILCDYKGFTDIEFNPHKGIATQARACAVFVSLLKKELLDDRLYNRHYFLSCLS